MSDGLQRVRRADGAYSFYWVARRVSRHAAGYEIKTCRLSDDADEAQAQARVHAAKLREWIAGRATASTFSGTIGSLIDCYRSDEDSPYRGVKSNTRREYDQSLDLLKKWVGHGDVATLTRKDFAHWHRAFKAPKTTGGPERERRAWGCMKLLRTIASYGVSMRYEGCRDMRDILAEMRFEMPAARESSMTFEQASAIVDLALSLGSRSIALAQALQFETTLRQKDVIGEWTFEPTSNENAKSYEGGIASHGSRWSGGVLWSDLSPDMILRKKTTKTRASSAWNLTLCPLVLKVLATIPAEERIGPMVVCETTGRPYRADPFRLAWRKIADAAGVPKDVWNMDSRSGGLTEADAAGADRNDIQRQATHKDPRMTDRYIRGDNLKANERVATFRVASRKKGQDDG